MSDLKVIQLLPELNIGGVERGTKDFSKALVEKGHKSIVISNGGIFENDIVENGGKHIKLPVHKKSLFSFFISKKLKKIYEQEKPDIVHVRSRIPAWINYFAIKKLTDKPILISTFHGLYSTPVYSQIMSKVDHTIAISKTVEDYIISTYKLSEDQITTIPRGCDPKVFNKNSNNKEYTFFGVGNPVLNSSKLASEIKLEEISTKRNFYNISSQLVSLPETAEELKYISNLPIYSKTLNYF